jgi:hypothetical protein
MLEVTKQLLCPKSSDQLWFFLQVVPLLLIHEIRQATLRAEDILNSWPELELGRILREYGEESNWQSVQKQIVKARVMGGLHSTGDLVKLIQRMCSISSGMCDLSTMLPLKVFFLLSMLCRGSFLLVLNAKFSVLK